MQYSAGLSHLVGSQDPRMPPPMPEYPRLQAQPRYGRLPSGYYRTPAMAFMGRPPYQQEWDPYTVWRPQDLPEGDPVLYGSVLSEVLQRFWESEEPPTADRRKPEDDECELFYQYNTARCSSGRFVTRLPFLPNRPALGIVHIAIPRKLVPSVGCKATLHGFCDASERGYAAAVYLLTASSTGTVHVRLVMAKSKVAPVRTRWTIPKLELAGAALLARLLNHVTCNLRGTINLDETVYAWTDSRIVLCWLQTSVHTLEVFVANRVSQITGSETPLVWRHVPGEWNPADCASRGCRAPDLVSHPLWWGPQWLTESPQEWPFNECRAPLGPPDRGWIKRFVNNCRKPQAERNYTPVLSPAERNAALCSLVRVVQAEHFEEEVAGDMNIMFENAKQYNVPTSRLYKDAVKLQRIMQQRVQELLDIQQSSSSDDESLSSVKNQVNTPRPRGRFVITVYMNRDNARTTGYPAEFLKNQVNTPRPRGRFVSTVYMNRIMQELLDIQQSSSRTRSTRQDLEDNARTTGYPAEFLKNQVNTPRPRGGFIITVYMNKIRTTGYPAEFLQVKNQVNTPRPRGRFVTTVVMNRIMQELLDIQQSSSRTRSTRHDLEDNARATGYPAEFLKNQVNTPRPRGRFVITVYMNKIMQELLDIQQSSSRTRSTRQDLEDNARTTGYPAEFLKNQVNTPRPRGRFVIAVYMNRIMQELLDIQQSSFSSFKNQFNTPRPRGRFVITVYMNRIRTTGYPAEFLQVKNQVNTPRPRGRFVIAVYMNKIRTTGYPAEFLQVKNQVNTPRPRGRFVITVYMNKIRTTGYPAEFLKNQVNTPRPRGRFVITVYMNKIRTTGYPAEFLKNQDNARTTGYPAEFLKNQVNTPRPRGRFVTTVGVEEDNARTTGYPAEFLKNQVNTPRPRAEFPKNQVNSPRPRGRFVITVLYEQDNARTTGYPAEFLKNQVNSPRPRAEFPKNQVNSPRPRGRFVITVLYEQDNARTTGYPAEFLKNQVNTPRPRGRFVITVYMNNIRTTGYPTEFLKNQVNTPRPRGRFVITVYMNRIMQELLDIQQSSSRTRSTRQDLEDNARTTGYPAEFLKNQVNTPRPRGRIMQELLDIQQSSSRTRSTRQDLEDNARTTGYPAEFLKNQVNSPRPRGRFVITVYMNRIMQELLDIQQSSSRTRSTRQDLEDNARTTGYPAEFLKNQVNTPRPRGRFVITVYMNRIMQELLDIQQSSSSDDESLSSVKNQVNTPRPRGRPRVNPLPVSAASPISTPVKSNLPLKKKLHYIARQLVEFTCSDGRQPMLLFMEKPSKKLYPEYYNVIDRPIDMITIEANIKNDRYNSIEEMVSDFRLMFANCRQFNEEGSMIYEDANLLERVMTEKLKEVNSGVERKAPIKTFKAAKSRQLNPLEQKLRTLYDAIRDFRDPKANRQLALIFMKLPSKTEYPDYYDIIKNPIDMEKIAHKLKNGVYLSVNELASDFILMFDNACKYNEPDSQIYKDALILQRVCLQTKQMLREDDETIPDVPSLVQELLLNLFTTVYNHQDEEGRCYSDSMAELPEHDETSNGDKVRAISLDLVKRRLDRGLYKRLDHFQQDMFAVFERARRLSRTDSQIFEDSVELQSYYIQQRDILCKNTLQSPALNFTTDALRTSVELVKQCKLLQETEDEDETRSSTDDSLPAGGAPLTQAQYGKGDFVYVQPEKGNKEPTIVQVERVWTNNEGTPMMYGNVYYRPHETFHVRTRKFLQQEVFKTETHRTIPLDQIIGPCHQEVFKTETHRTIPLDQIIGPCHVMNVKEYFKFRPQGFLDKDVYVCESRYSTRNRWFKKIKVWEGAEKEVNLIPREVPLEPNRTVSVFRERVEKHKDELAELEILENVQEKERPDVVMYNPLGTDDENTYYEQYNTVCSGVIKTGDYVYVVTDGGKQVIAQVDTIWETGDNKCYFRGPFLIFPAEVANIINKPFYKQEVLLTTMHDTSPLVGIVGKCAVLDYDDYLKCRPTEIAEGDCYLCECVYDESNRIARKLKSGLRKFEHTKDVTVDEIYYFSRQLGPPALATASDFQPSSNAFTQKSFNHTINVDAIDGKPQFTNLINTTIGSQDVEMLLENSLDDSSLASPATPLSIGGNSNSYNPSLSSTQERSQPMTTPSSSKKKKEQKQKIVTGYILYSSEVRKAIVANNPESTFGEISRIVGNEWRSLPASTKQSWEERAAKCNEETSAKLAEEMRELSQHTPMEMTYECLWGDCDYQFEDLQDCMEHCIGDGGNMIGTFIETKKPKLEPGHVQNHYRSGSFADYPCLWRNCARVRKGQAPFPNLPRLLRHVRDLHVNKGNGRVMPIHERNRNFLPSSKKPPKATYNTNIRSGVMSPGGMARNTPSPGGEATLATAPPPTRAGLEPLFVAAPPRAQRVTHSEAYIRYIEGLHSEQKYITPWEKQLTPMPSNPDPANFNMHKLPAHWMTDEAVQGYLAHDKTVTETDLAKMDHNAKILKGLCALRDFLMKDALCVYKNTTT
ncbi:bromodomain-containing protein [Phthorimaea operculella]|nr:bromodomain-containing protein [Phthorimaea operculella]